MRVARRTILLSIALGLLSLAAPKARAATVSSLTAVHHDGQTFLTWVFSGSTGWSFTVYSSSSPITKTSDLLSARAVGVADDSTWNDRRLSRILGGYYPYRITDTAMPLTSAQGMFVVTTKEEGIRYYAVMARHGTDPEDQTIFVGSNSLSSPVDEVPALPKPVYQRTILRYGYLVDIYTLWTWSEDVTGFRAMANQPSMPFDCGVVQGGPGGALLVRPHARGSNFLEAVGGSGMPREWRLALDDPLWNDDSNTFFYGYHQDYNVDSDTNVPPLTGMVHDYTLARAIYTVEWALNTFPVDHSRVYAEGTSMGGIGSVFMAARRPDLFAAVLTNVAKFDFSFIDDPNANSGFNPNEPLREVTNRLWGSTQVDLPATPDGHVFEYTNLGAMAGYLEQQGLPPIIAFNGRNDTVTGWAEKIPFYQAMERSRQGGAFFWDERAHNNSTEGAWWPMQSMLMLYRYRSDRSFPALSNCSLDGNPGNGMASDGDSVGCINGYVQWDTMMVDQAGYWSTTLRTRGLTTLWGSLPQPASLTVDVTPRRLQKFRVADGVDYAWTVRRKSDGTVLQSGIVQPDNHHLITIRGVRVEAGGTVLTLTHETNVKQGIAADPLGSTPTPALELVDGVAHDALRFSVRWPSSGRGTVDLIDLSGRRVRRVLDGVVNPGLDPLSVGTRGLASGMYFLSVRQDGRPLALRRVAIVH